MVHIGVLGPLVVTVGDRSAEITTPMLRRLLALLVAQPGIPIDADVLADQLWSGQPPRNARKTIAVYVHRLRRILGSDELILFGPSGYTIDTAAVRLDTLELELSAKRVAGATDPPAREIIAAGLALWRGQPFQGLQDMSVTDRAAQRFDEIRAGLLEHLFELQLGWGEHAEVVGPVRDAIAEYPYRENLHAQLMLALYRSGRRVEALEAYREMYRLLSTDLGVEPLPELQRLHQRILNDDRGLITPTSPAPAEAPPPAQLPAAVVDFTGRSGPLSEMEAWSAGPMRHAPLLICGGAGLGKTALAIHWGSRYVAATGAGHLYLNLRGHSSDPPLRPIDALSYFLRSLGTAAEEIPVDAAEASALFRSRIADRHLLIVLDNAASAEQVSHLLPGRSENLVIITSRERLSALVARHGAQRISLGRFTQAEAVNLLRRLVGAAEVDAEADAATELARLCGLLPLALRVAAANLVDGRYASIGALVADISDTSWPAPFDLDEDADAGVRVAFDHSYSRLEPQRQKLFRLLSIVPGPDFTLNAVRSFAEDDTDDETLDVLQALHRLVGAHLVEQHAPGRFGLHDLVHRYAHSVSADSDPQTVREAARQALYRYYLRSCDEAARVAYREVLRLPWTDSDAPGPREGFTGPAEAMAWLDTERHNLIAALNAALDGGDAAIAGYLADMLRGFFSVRRLRSDWLAVSDVALRAAEQMGDPQARIAARLSSSMALWASGDYDEAASILHANAELARQAGWLDGAVSSLGNLGGIYGEWGKLREAADCLEQALRLQSQEGRATTKASILTNLGAMSADLGRLDASVEYATAAMRLFDEIGVKLGAARAQGNLGETLRTKGNLIASKAHLNAALSRLDGLGDSHAEAAVHVSLALWHYEQDEPALAREAALRAKQLAEQAGSQIQIANALSALALIDGDRRLHEEAIAVLVECKAARHENEARLCLATTLLSQGGSQADLPLTQSICQDVISGCRDGGYRHVEANALALLAEIHRRCHRTEQASATAKEALALLAEVGNTRDTARLRAMC